MKKRFIYLIVYIFLYPTFLVAMLLAFICMFIAPIVCVITGDEDKAWNTVFGGIQGWIVDLPDKITSKL